MDSFHYEYILLVQLHEVAVKTSFPFLEVEAWMIYFLHFQKLVQLLSDEFQVHGLQGLEIIFSVRIDRCQMSVDEIVVKLYYLRVEP